MGTGPVGCRFGAGGPLSVSRKRPDSLDSSLDNDGIFRCLGGEWKVVDSIGQLDTGDVISFVTRVLNTILPLLVHVRRVDVEIPSWSAASLGVFGST